MSTPDGAYLDKLCTAEKEEPERKRIANFKSQYTLINAAVSSTPLPFIDLWLGETHHFGGTVDPDEATIRTDLAVYKEDAEVNSTHMRVPTIQLSDILEVLPMDRSIEYGLLKTDLQGSDGTALMSGWEHLAKFACIHVEWWGYELLDDSFVDLGERFWGLGFLQVTPARRFLPQPHDARGPGCILLHQQKAPSAIYPTRGLHLLQHLRRYTICIHKHAHAHARVQIYACSYDELL
jgi:hypothetical protein